MIEDTSSITKENDVEDVSTIVKLVLQEDGNEWWELASLGQK
jgi:hypothetical protein